MFKPEVKTSTYYRKPEGQDIIGKLGYTSKYAAWAGVSLGIVDAQLFAQSKTYLGALGRVAYYTGPLVGLSAAFVTTTYIATNVRGKDDKYNYALGGIASGSVLGAWRRSIAVGLISCAVLAIAGILKKEAIDNNLVFFPTPPAPEHRALGSPNFDFTLADEIPGNWTTGH